MARVQNLKQIYLKFDITKNWAPKPIMLSCVRKKREIFLLRDPIIKISKNSNYAFMCKKGTNNLSSFYLFI